MSAPDVNEPDGVRDALDNELKRLPLAGRKTKITREVEDWAGTHGRQATDPALLDDYNTAAERAGEELRTLLDRRAESQDGKRVLIGLLGRAVASDSVRLAVLDTLEPIVGPEDANELARINTGQRPQVLGRAIQVLAATACATALFALRKVYSEREDSATAAGRLADGLDDLLPEAIAIRRALVEESDRRDASELDQRETLLCVLALSSAEQTKLASSPSGRGLMALAHAAAPDLDAHLRAEAAGASSLGRFHARLRDDLLEFVLLADVPDERLRDRALENVFRREDLKDVRELLIQLPDSALKTYADPFTSGTTSPPYSFITSRWIACVLRQLTVRSKGRNSRDTSRRGE